MSNLIQLHPEQNPEVITLTAYLREDGRPVYVDDKTSITYFTKTSFADFVQTDRRTLGRHLEALGTNGDLWVPQVAQVKAGKGSTTAHAYSVQQVAEYCKIHNPELVFGGESYYLNAKELHEIGYIQHVVSPADQVIITQAEADIQSIKRLMGGVINTALALPGYNALGNSVGWVEPKFYKPSLTAREWVETHHPDLPLFSKTNMLRIGRAFSSAVIQNHQVLATNSWTNANNKYQEIHHQVLCTSFYNISKLGLIA